MEWDSRIIADSVILRPSDSKMASGARWPLTRYYRGFIINWLPINARHSTYTRLLRFIGNDLSALRHRWIRDATHSHRDPSSIVNERQRPWRSAAIRVFPAIFSSHFPARICSTFQLNSVIFHYQLFSTFLFDLLILYWHCFSSGIRRPWINQLTPPPVICDTPRAVCVRIKK